MAIVHTSQALSAGAGPCHRPDVIGAVPGPVPGKHARYRQAEGCFVDPTWLITPRG